MVLMVLRILAVKKFRGEPVGAKPEQK